MDLECVHSGFPAGKISKVCAKALPRVEELRSLTRDFFYTSDASSVALPFDARFASESITLAKKFTHVELVVIIGIGGSNLGAQAVIEAVLGKQHNLFSKRKILWADSIDASNLAVIQSAVNEVAASKTLFILISKSGKTTETISNFQALWKKGVNVVVISDEDSPLRDFASLNGFQFLPVPKKVGGRYSVLSNVGLFPLAVMNIDIEKLLAGARKGCESALSLKWRENPALIMASLLYLHAASGKRINELFFFASDLESLGKWYRQLLAESIGKEKNLHGKIVHEGITPIVSNAVDLHSQAQLYFGGKNDRVYTIVNVDKQKSFPITFSPHLQRVVPEVQGKTTVQVADAISTGFKKSLAYFKRPFVELTLAENSESEIGELMQVQMVQVMLLASMLKVNAFDQPGVEHYKMETKKLLQ